MFQVVTCDPYVLLGLEGFPCKARESNGVWRKGIVPCSSSSWLLPFAVQTSRLTNRKPSSEVNNLSLRTVWSSAQY